MPLRRIPLFPLEVVLLPGNLLPLHIFEPRYKLMIGRAIEQSQPFGIVLALEEGIATVGCTAMVARVNKTYDDGQMDIETIGESAYRIGDLYDEQPYLEGGIELLSDDLAPPTAGVAEELRNVFAQCHLLIHDSPPSAVEIAPGQSLAYRLAGELPLDLKVAQELLETRSEAARQRKLIERLNEMLPVLVRMRDMRIRARGNGHGLN